MVADNLEKPGKIHKEQRKATHSQSPTVQAQQLINFRWTVQQASWTSPGDLQRKHSRNYKEKNTLGFTSREATNDGLWYHLQSVRYARQWHRISKSLMVWKVSRFF